MISAADIERARERLRPHIRVTPLEASPALTAHCGFPVALKLESLQVTGTFKPRISFSKLLAMTDAERRRGVVAPTAGGHGIGLSYAAERLAVPCTICLPATADPRKMAVIERQGARMLRYASMDEARQNAVRIAREEGLTYVSAYNDRDVIAGGGTVGLEILDAAPGTDLVVVGMGGGGLASGIAIAMKERNPGAQVWGVQPVTTAVLGAWMAAGRPVPFPHGTSIADGLGARIEEDSITFPLASRLVDRVVTVTDDEIRSAMLWLLEEHQLVAEPSGAAPIAALLKAQPRSFASAAVVVTGRNISKDRYLSFLVDAQRAAA